MRDHQSHDVLLMCVHCHQESNLHDFGLRKALEEECDAPIGTADDVKVCQYDQQFNTKLLYCIGCTCSYLIMGFYFF